MNFSDPSGLSRLSNAFKQAGHVFEDIGHFVEKQWDNGNIQKGLLVAGTLASGGMLGFGLAAGTLGTAEIFAGTLGVTSGLANSYEVFSGNRIGDGTFTRVLGAAAAVTGGFYAPGVKSFGTFGRSLSGASGLVSGYEIGTGNYIGDGTLSSLFNVTNLGINHGSTLFSSEASAAQRFGVGLNLAVGGTSVFKIGDRGLQQALRSLGIATGIWNTGSEAITAYQTTQATMEALRPTPIQVRAQSQIQQVAYQEGEGSGGGQYRLQPEQLKRSQTDPYLDAVTGNQPFGFTDDLLNPRIASFQSVIDMPIEYAPEVGYRTTGFFRQTEEVAQIRRFNAAKEQYWTTAHKLAEEHGSARLSLLAAEAAYKADITKGSEYTTAFRQYNFAQNALETHTGEFKPMYRFQAPPEKPMTDFEAGRTWVDSWLIDPVASTSTGYADAWTGGYTSTLQSRWYGEGLNAYNRDSYFYAGGSIAGTATFAYATGAGVTRAGAFAAGFAPTATYAVGAGATVYGGYQLYEHTANTIENWNSLSGPQRLSAIGVPIAGLVGGYAGYKSVPTETIFQWQSAGASSRAYTNRLASSLWADEAGTITTGGWQAPQSATQWSRAPKSIQDRLALEAAQRGSGRKLIDNLGDPKFKGMEKWEYNVKSQDGLDSVVHYVRDPKTGTLLDFKFKKHSIDTPGIWGTTIEPRVSPTGN